MKTSLSFVLVAVGSFCSCATDTTESDVAALSGYAETGERHGHHGPPQEAIDACATAAAGATCAFTFTFNSNALTGVCVTPPPRPPGGPHGPGDGAGSGSAPPPAVASLVCMPPPPQVVIDACIGLAIDAACTFTSPRTGADVTGTCQTAPTGSVIACRPDRGPPPPHDGSGSGS